MKVLHICAGNLYGGVESVLVTFARARALCPQLQPHFGVCFEGRLSAELRTIGVPVHMLGSVRISRPWTVLKVRRALSALIAQEHFDVIACHSAWPHAVFGPVVRAHNITLAIWLHSNIKGPRWLEQWAQATAPDVAICVSRTVAETTAINAYPDTRAEILYNPVAAPAAVLDASARVQLRAEFDTAADAIVIIQVSRMEAWKGHKIHLQALALLPPQLQLISWFVGGAQRTQEAAYLNELKREAAQLGIIDRVRFLGERTDVSRLLAAADIFCQPNLEPEGFGLVFVEAGFAGLPIITTALGGAREIVNESCGILLPANDSAAVAQALQMLIKDEKLRALMSTASRQRAAQLCDTKAQLMRLNDILALLARKL